MNPSNSNQIIEHNAGTCKSCKGDVVWVRLASGKKMICDVQADGSITPDCVQPDVGKKRLVVDCYLACVVSATHDRPVTGWEPHWGTCPNADKHRKPKGMIQ
jgi:hypothetical protein